MKPLQAMLFVIKVEIKKSIRKHADWPRVYGDATSWASLFYLLIRCIECSPFQAVSMAMGDPIDPVVRENFIKLDKDRLYKIK